MKRLSAAAIIVLLPCSVTHAQSGPPNPARPNLSSPYHSKLASKVIVITGASSGLGKQLALMSAQAGAKVILVSDEKDPLRTLNHQINANGGYSEFVHCDIRSRKQVATAATYIRERFKRIDILINNAGVWTDDNLEKVNPQKRNEAFSVNALGNIQFNEAVLPMFQRQNAGHIFNVLSTSALPDLKEGTNTKWKSYGASKWAFAGYTKALRESLAYTNIKVTEFLPGGFDSKLYERVGRPQPHSQPWMMKVEDVAEVAMFVLSRPDDVLIPRIVVTKVQHR